MQRRVLQEQGALSMMGRTIDAAAANAGGATAMAAPDVASGVSYDPALGVWSSPWYPCLLASMNPHSSLMQNRLSGIVVALDFVSGIPSQYSGPLRFVHCLYVGQKPLTKMKTSKLKMNPGQDLHAGPAPEQAGTLLCATNGCVIKLYTFRVASATSPFDIFVALHNCCTDTSTCTPKLRRTRKFASFLTFRY